MKKPKNPDEIILKNKYYPNGLTTNVIYKYYKSNKKQILEYCKDRPVILNIKPDLKSEILIKRLHKQKPIFLSSDNYDEFINYRTLSISYEPNTFNKITHIILDIDNKKNGVDFNKLKAATKDIRSRFHPWPFYKNISSIDINIFPSPNGFHIIYETTGIKKFSDIDDLRSMMEIELKRVFSNLYDINDKKAKGINIDLSPMSKRGSITVPYSLTRAGTKYIPIDIKSYNIDQVTI
jgi:hypothetical protein